MTFSQDKPPTVPDRSSLRSPVTRPWRRRVGSLLFLGLATALHSLAFVVPWPETAQVEEPEPEVLLEPEPPAISVSQLPPGSPELASKVAETAEKTTPPNQSTPQPERRTPASRPEPAPSKPEAEIPETLEAETPEALETEPPETPNTGDHPPESGSSGFSVGDPITGSPTYVQDVVGENLFDGNLTSPYGLGSLITIFLDWLAGENSDLLEDKNDPQSSVKVNSQTNYKTHSILICDSDLDSGFSPSNVLIGILLDPSNQQIRYDPKILTSSGSQGLDASAKDEIAGGFHDLISPLTPDPETANWDNAYFIEVEFKAEQSECSS